MKELYIAPQMETVSFLSNEKMAVLGGVDMDDLLGGDAGAELPEASNNLNAVVTPVN